MNFNELPSINIVDAHGKDDECDGTSEEQSKTVDDKL